MNNDIKGDFYSFKRLIKYLKPYLLHTIISFILMIIIVGLELIQPILFAKVIDSISVKNNFNVLIKFSLLYTTIVIFGGLFQYGQGLLLQCTSEKIIYKIRNDVFSHIQRMEIEFFNKTPIGKLVTSVTNDVEAINEMYTNFIINSIKNIFIIIGIVIVMFSLNLKLSLIIYTIIPIMVGTMVVFRKYSKGIYRQIRENIAFVNTFLSEHISGMKVIQVFVREKQKYNEFVKINEKLNKSYKNEVVALTVLEASTYFFRIILTGIILFFGGENVLKGTMTIGTLLAFTQYISKFFNPIQQLAGQFNLFQSAMASAERIFGLLDQDQALKDKENSVELNKIKGSIEFKNVWFAYKEEEWILKDVSFKIKSGEKVAIVGATGAGKTTILNLIGKYYKIKKGKIFLDGINIEEIKTESIRKNIGQMLQDVFIYASSIEENIKLKDRSISDEDMMDASKQVNAHKFIEKLPNKYKESVCERGTNLSAGQKQLLSFARTIVRNPSILILDEATANIDTETEKLIQDALFKIMKGRTTLAVAHRLSTIQHCDKIILLDKGRIREIGTHEDLLKNRGFYYNLVQLQYK